MKPFSLLLILLLVSCAPSQPERMHSFVEGYAFKGGEKEQRELERRAKAGDSEAALRLGRYFEMVMNDYSTALRWFDLSARLGNAKGASNARSLRSVLHGSDQ